MSLISTITHFLGAKLVIHLWIADSLPVSEDGDAMG